MFFLKAITSFLHVETNTSHVSVLRSAVIKNGRKVIMVRETNVGVAGGLGGRG